MTACIWICAGLAVVGLLLLLLLTKHPFDPPQEPTKPPVEISVRISWAEADQIIHAYNNALAAFQRRHSIRRPPVRMTSVVAMLEVLTRSTIGDLQLPLVPEQLHSLRQFATDFQLPWLVRRLDGTQTQGTAA